MLKAQILRIGYQNIALDKIDVTDLTTGKIKYIIDTGEFSFLIDLVIDSLKINEDDVGVIESYDCDYLILDEENKIEL